MILKEKNKLLLCGHVTLNQNKDKFKHQFRAVPNTSFLPLFSLICESSQAWPGLAWPGLVQPTGHLRHRTTEPHRKTSSARWQVACEDSCQEIRQKAALEMLKSPRYPITPHNNQHKHIIACSLLEFAARVQSVASSSAKTGSL